eukprot:6555139-Alexandrium_andersonii.AAC.1
MAPPVRSAAVRPSTALARRQPGAGGQQLRLHQEGRGGEEGGRKLPHAAHPSPRAARGPARRRGSGGEVVSGAAAGYGACSG